MDKENISNITKYGYPLKTKEDADFLIKMFKQQFEHYHLKNTQHENLLSRLKVSPDSLSFNFRETLEKFAKLEDAAGVDKLNSIDIGMSFLEQATAKYKYQSKSQTLKDQVEDLSQLTNTVQTDIKNIQCELISSREQIQNMIPISPNELEKLQLKIKSYENKLLHYINEYPWTDSPQYNLLSIHDEIKKLYELQSKAEKLESELECYQGLKPDLFVAKNQLTKLKSEYEEITKMVAELDRLKIS